MIRVVGYVRVSTDKQTDVGISIPAQRTRIEAYAVAMGLHVVAIEEDAAESAKTLDRPGLHAALQMLDDGRASGLVVVKLDRLTRSIRDIGELVERYFSKGKKLISLSDSIDTGTAAGKLVINILVSVAQWEREAIGERTRDALQYKASLGEFCGGQAPYGYSVENGLLVPNEAEQGVLRIVRELKDTGLSLNAIAKDLAHTGFAPRSGKVWHAQQIKRMLMS